MFYAVTVSEPHSGEELAGVTCLVGGRQDGGHVDPPGLQLVSQRVGEEVEGSFRRAVRSQAGERLVTCGHGFRVM